MKNRLNVLIVALLVLFVGLAAAGDSNFTNLVTTGDITAGDDLTVTDDAAIGGNLAVTGTSTFTGATAHTGAVTDDAKLTINDNALIDGDSDEVQLTVQAYVTQTTDAPVFVIETSAGTNKFVIDHAGYFTSTSHAYITGNATIVGSATLSRTTGYEVVASEPVTSGAISLVNNLVFLNAADVGLMAMTLAAPTSGTMDGLKIRIYSKTAVAHTITATTIGFNALDAAGDVCTLGGAAGDGITIIADEGEWWIVERINCTLG